MTVPIKVRVGTRPSLLAFKQVEEIHKLVPETIFDIVAIETEGDKDKATPLSQRENTNFFAGEIEKALLNGEIDIAIHSAKDLEPSVASDLFFVVMTKSISPFDCLVSRKDYTLVNLPPGSVIGTSSISRRDSIFRYRQDLIAKDIRGNVDERIAQLDRGDFDAIIVAHAALIRLNLENRISQIIPSHIIEPHLLQGRLAVQIHKDKNDLIEIFRSINEA